MPVVMRGDVEGPARWHWSIWGADSVRDAWDVAVEGCGECQAAWCDAEVVHEAGLGVWGAEMNESLRGCAQVKASVNERSESQKLEQGFWRGLSVDSNVPGIGSDKNSTTGNLPVCGFL
ncbi:hypothetical protein F5887DRAFT_920328 [Amanita rubescens]|nr:hypothetical protein F5887DRAFT_920328 [Amanita rubescens]